MNRQIQENFFQTAYTINALETNTISRHPLETSRTLKQNASKEHCLLTRASRAPSNPLRVGTRTNIGRVLANMAVTSHFVAWFDFFSF